MYPVRILKSGEGCERSGICTFTSTYKTTCKGTVGLTAFPPDKAQGSDNDNTEMVEVYFPDGRSPCPFLKKYLRPARWTDKLKRDMAFLVLSGRMGD